MAKQQAQSPQSGSPANNRSATRTPPAGAADKRNTRSAQNSPRPKKRFGLLQLGVLVLLLILPVMALVEQVAPDFHRWIICWVIVWSVASFLSMKADKLKAASEQWRTPEATLHLLELLGGWPGSFIAQRLYRHKTAKKSYQATFWLIVLLYQLVSLDALQNWLWANQFVHWLERL